MKKLTFIVFLFLVVYHHIGFAQNPIDTILLDTTLSDKNDSIIEISETLPEFPGGENEMYAYLAKSLTYPTNAQDNNIQGRVYLTFIVEIDGSISHIKCLRGIGGGCDKEAIRAVKAMPKWTAGIQKGKKVRVRYNLPIVFKLQGGKLTKEQKALQKVNRKQYKQQKKEEEKKLMSSPELESLPG